jgi:hypothetical protein
MALSHYPRLCRQYMQKTFHELLGYMLDNQGIVLRHFCLRILQFLGLFNDDCRPQLAEFVADAIIAGSIVDAQVIEILCSLLGFLMSTLLGQTGSQSIRFNRRLSESLVDWKTQIVDRLLNDGRMPFILALEDPEFWDKYVRPQELVVFVMYNICGRPHSQHYNILRDVAERVVTTDLVARIQASLERIEGIRPEDLMLWAIVYVQAQLERRRSGVEQSEN